MRRINDSDDGLAFALVASASVAALSTSSEALVTRMILFFLFFCAGPANASADSPGCGLVKKNFRHLAPAPPPPAEACPGCGHLHEKQSGRHLQIYHDAELDTLTLSCKSWTHLYDQPVLVSPSYGQLAPPAGPKSRKQKNCLRAAASETT